MKQTLILLCAALTLSACAPVTQLASRAVVVITRDGDDLIVPNPGTEAYLDGWALTLEATPDTTLDAAGAAWCPERRARVDPKTGPFLELRCRMPALAGGLNRRVHPLTGRLTAAQGLAYTASSGTRTIPLVLP
jgi:hypothetical protein